MMTDSQKLFTLADWLDLKDSEQGVASSEVQQDLRRIANELDQDRGTAKGWVSMFAVWFVFHVTHDAILVFAGRYVTFDFWMMLVAVTAISAIMTWLGRRVH